MTHERKPAAMHGKHAIRDGDWKLVTGARGVGPTKVERSQFELYNLAEDISEQNDLSQGNPEEAKRLFGEFIEFIERRALK